MIKILHQKILERDPHIEKSAKAYYYYNLDQKYYG